MDVVVSIPRPSEGDIEAGYNGNGGENFDYSQRAQWLRAAVLGGNEGIVSSAVLLLGLGMFELDDTNAWIITGLVGLFAGALNLAVAEFVSVYTQVEIVRSQNNRDLRLGKVGAIERMPPPPPFPAQIALVASLAYVVAGMVPPVAAMAVKDRKLRFFVAAVSASLSMVAVGNIGALLGKAPLTRSCARVIIGGWIEIAIMLGKRKVLQVCRQ